MGPARCSWSVKSLKLVNFVEDSQEDICVPLTNDMLRQARDALPAMTHLQLDSCALLDEAVEFSTLK